MSVNENLGVVNNQPRSVVDINEIFQADGLPFQAAGGTIVTNQHVWAFVYKDNAGQYWVQIDPAFQWTMSFSAGVNAWALSFGISVNAPTGTAPKGPLASPPPPAQGQKYAKCFSQGNKWG